MSVEIRTQRFVLRELTLDDVCERYLEWLRDPDARRFVMSAAVTQEMDDLRRYVRDRLGREDVLFLGIFDAESGVHIGNIKYEPVDASAGYAIMGVLIGDCSYRGRGVTTEVLNESMDWLRANRGIKEIALGVGEDNRAAIRVQRPYHGRMKIDILTSDAGHPVVSRLLEWSSAMRVRGHDVRIAFDKTGLEGGDLLFLVSCAHIVRDEDRRRYSAALVLHASDLPQGRGWSPHVWAIVGGASRVPVCLLEARDPVDTGDVWLRTTFDLEGHELLPEINEKLFAAELGLMTEAVEQFGSLQPVPQAGDPGPYMKKRTPDHSRLDPDLPIAQQFQSASRSG